MSENFIFENENEPLASGESENKSVHDISFEPSEATSQIGTVDTACDMIENSVEKSASGNVKKKLKNAKSEKSKKSLIVVKSYFVRKRKMPRVKVTRTKPAHPDSRALMRFGMIVAFLHNRIFAHSTVQMKYKKMKKNWPQNFVS